MASSQEVGALIAELKAAASRQQPFAENELDSALQSMKNLTDSFDWGALRELWSTSAHLPHKEWLTTEASAEALARILPGLEDLAFRSFFHRVLQDGHWDSAAAVSASRPPGAKPWVVLVSGVNGIRKTTSLYQPWFREVLAQALAESHPSASFDRHELPCGGDSFFRQLDYLVATVANEEFRALYKLEDVELYSSLKDALFARYRTIAEVCGALLVAEARRKKMNVMVETSGRDVASFHYVNHFFPDAEYRKLVVYFEIDDISCAEKSVDARMQKEMREGQEALGRNAEAKELIKANAGGPYGSQVLKQVQAESQKVWHESVLQGLDVASSWYKATICIHGSDSAEWTAQAHCSSESAAGRDVFQFVPP
ncbi:unnamed protein product [Polarella glacialis]|uniref:Uncharacterized protein n=1 Tax=Polarella glacialis TaxID=89957 RepID=A0A813H499_POLGL|nr:unnamed protein product [Polarella glacialis]